MTIFSRLLRPLSARRAGTKSPVLSRDDVIAGFKLLLERPPLDELELHEALRCHDLPELVRYLLGSAEFRARYAQITRSERARPSEEAVVERRPAIFLGDRVLCWTHHGQRIYLVPQDIDLTPRILLSGDWENHVEQTMLRLLRSGDTVIDLGANVGYHTINFCTAVAPAGMVYSFEPHPELMRLLTATIFINHLEPMIELHCCAVADRAGTMTLALSPCHFGSGNIVPDNCVPGYDEDYSTRLQVPAVTLDATLANRVRTVDLIHMDIEGSEPLALRGAQMLIERSPALKIVTEWSVGIMRAHNVDIGAYISWLEGLGFRFWRIDNNTADLIPLEGAALWELPHSDLLLSRGDPG